MIIFFDKETGEITGRIDGRVHDESVLKMWIGDLETTDRLIIEWKPRGKEVKESVEEVAFVPAGKTEKGEEVFKRIVQNKTITHRDFEPDLDQKAQRDIFMRIERGEIQINDYRVDIRTKKLVKK